MRSSEGADNMTLWEKLTAIFTGVVIGTFFAILLTVVVWMILLGVTT